MAPGWRSATGSHLTPLTGNENGGIIIVCREPLSMQERTQQRSNDAHSHGLKSKQRWEGY